MKPPTRSATDRSLGTELVDSIVTRDVGALVRLFSTPVTFRAVTPRRFWDADTPVGVADIVLGAWFSPEKTVTGVTSLETDTVATVEKVGYRMTVDLPTGPSVIEQVGYFSQRDGEITQMRLVCSGFCPV